MPFPLAMPLATAGISALGGLLGNWLGRRGQQQQYPMGQMGSPYGNLMTQQIPGSGTLVQTQRFLPQQQQALNQILQQALSGIGKTYDFEPIAEQARKGFREKTLPSIAERFTGMGEGTLSSSGYKQMLQEAGTNLESQLAALRSQYGLQQGSQLQNLLSMGLTPQFETGMVPQAPGFMNLMGGGLGQGLGMFLPLLLMQYLGGGFGGSTPQAPTTTTT